MPKKMNNNLTVGLKDCLVDLFHEPSSAGGSGRDVTSAMISLGASKEFQKWVAKEVAGQLPKGESADAIASFDPKTSEIRVVW